MGIKGLWDILEAVKQSKKLDEFQGKKLAVDFSIWLMECKSLDEKALPILSNRAIFFRVINLMSHGITPVFVLDSAETLELKERKRGQHFSAWNSEWKELLEAMGFPVIQSHGEAEKTCAYLTKSSAVDSCLSNDGDSFAYGAVSIIKNYKVGKEIHFYQMSEITKKLGLGQKEIIAAALILGCDHGRGVNKVGPKTFSELMKELKQNNIDDVLDRMKSWRSDCDIIAHQETLDIVKRKSKVKRCSNCQHTGDDTSKIACSCDFYKLEQIKPFVKELKVRESAMRDGNFPSEKIIEEYWSEDTSVPNDQKLFFQTPHEYSKIIDLLTGPFEISKEHAKKYFPAMLKMFIYGEVPSGIEVKPFEVPKKYQRKPSYLVKFKKFEFDTLETKDFYEFDISQNVFDPKFPEFSPPRDEKKPKIKKGKTAGHSSSSKGGKRHWQEDENKEAIKSYFKVKKEISTTTKSETKKESEDESFHV